MKAVKIATCFFITQIHCLNSSTLFPIITKSEQHVNSLFFDGNRGQVQVNKGSDEMSMASIHTFHKSVVYCKNLPFEENIGLIEAFIYKLLEMLRYGPESHVALNSRICTRDAQDLGKMEPISEIGKSACLHKDLLKFALWSAILNIGDGVLDGASRNYQIIRDLPPSWKIDGCKSGIITYDFSYLPGVYDFSGRLRNNLRKGCQGLPLFFKEIQTLYGNISPINIHSIADNKEVLNEAVKEMIDKLKQFESLVEITSMELSKSMKPESPEVMMFLGTYLQNTFTTIQVFIEKCRPIHDFS